MIIYRVTEHAFRFSFASVLPHVVSSHCVTVLATPFPTKEWVDVKVLIDSYGALACGVLSFFVMVARSDRTVAPPLIFAWARDSRAHHEPRRI